MNRREFRKLFVLTGLPFYCLICITVCASSLRAQQANIPDAPACGDTGMLSDNPCSAVGTQNDFLPAGLTNTLHAVRDRAYPELRKKRIEVKTFRSSSDYFQTRFSVSRFLLFRPMRYFVEVNPLLFSGSPPGEGVCSILAHELAHVSSLSHGNRLRLFGLVRLVSRGYTARFERRTDLEAIRRGYGPGLLMYREWVYQHIPPQSLERKRRNYFSSEEIKTMLELSKADPALFAIWKRHVPLNIEQIKASAANLHLDSGR
ncbi:MAG: hypothetical protein PVS2B2_12410 [Candidatus Acidiferrum sp.]